MPTTPQEKAAKWPWRITKLTSGVFVWRLAWQPTWGLPLKLTLCEFLGVYPTLAAAIAAIAKTQE